MQLQELKIELEQCEVDLHLCQNLLEKREGELHKIQALKTHVEAQLIEMHRLMATDPKRAEELKQHIAEERKKIFQLTEELRNIDAELDRLGEERESSFGQLKQDLIAKIQERFPETAAEYQTITRHLEKARSSSQGLVQQKKILMPLLDLLKQGDQINIKGGVFDFIFGKHPKALLARTIHKASTLGEKIYPEPSLDERFRCFLEKFLKETHKTWNHPLYRGLFSEFFREFSTLMGELEQEIRETQHSIAIQEQALENWIEKHCRNN